MIRKARETMTSRERVERTFAFEKTDRVTIGYEANPAVHAALCRALGVSPEDKRALDDALGVDYAPVSAPYVGGNPYPEKPDRRVNVLEGCYMRWVPNRSGGYWDFCDFPLKDAPDELFESYPIPHPDDFDYDEALAQAKALSGRYALDVGNPGVPDVINSNGRIMGMEDVLVHFMEKNEAALDFMRRRAESQWEVMSRTLEKCRGYISFVWLGEDLGTQRTPMVSLDLYRRILKPIHRRFIDLAKAYRLPVIIHTCGCSSWVYEDFIEMGVRGVDSLQPEAVDMSPEYLERHFSGRLTLRGLISTAGPLAYGTPEDVENDCRKVLEICMPHRGYHFAPSHAIQDNSPAENVIAMYQAAHRYGVYV
ncbi:MAG: hypothetical protein IJJ23_02395 [Clostridia bacterium]|nr:hypothetical protein [Clostridia bacterium]